MYWWRYVTELKKVETIPDSIVGKCQHCGEPVVFSNFFEFKCNHCGADLDNRSLGWTESGDGWKRVRRIGPDGEWHDINEELPEVFNILGFLVKVGPPKEVVQAEQ